MRPPRVVRIDRIRLHGTAPQDSARFRKLVELELGARLGGPPAPQRADAGDGALARHVAETVSRKLGGAE